MNDGSNGGVIEIDHHTTLRGRQRIGISHKFGDPNNNGHAAPRPQRRTSILPEHQMNVTDPTTWHDLAAHTRFAGGTFDPAWYEGDAGADLARLRACAIEVLAARPGATCELVVLDDCTTFFRFRTPTREADVYPVALESGAAGYYVGFPNLEEVRVDCVAGVIVALR